MSEHEFQGYITVRRIEDQGMISVRAELGKRPVINALKNATAVPMPEVLGANVAGKNGILWMSPDEAMVLCDANDSKAVTAKINKKLSRAHVLTVDVTSARAVFELEGPDVREVIAKLCPIDTDPSKWVVGQLRRTRIGQVAGAIWMTSNTTANVVCFRSVGDYVWGAICQSAKSESAVFT